MRENCGIVALDALLKSLNLNMNRISLDTLSKICRDNGRLMFPLKVPKDKLLSIGFPYILQTNNHYEVMEDENALDLSGIKDFAYVLHPTLNPNIIPLIIDEEESKGVKGACDVKNIPIIGPFLSKPARAIPLAVGAASSLLGLPGWAGNLMSTAAGAGQGATTGLWGEPGAGSMLTGAASGFGQGMVGQGLGGGIANWMNPAPNTTFNQGFMSGLGNAVPFKNAINSAIGTQLFPTSLTGVNAMATRPTALNTNVSNLSQITQPGTYQYQGQPVVATGESFLGGGVGGDRFAPSLTSGGTAAGKSGANNLLSYLMMGAGSLIPNPEYNMPSSSDIATKMQDMGATTAEGAAARQKMLDYINNPQNIGGQATTNYLTSINAYYDDLEKRELAAKQSQWEALGYNSYSSDYQKLRDDFQLQQSLRRSNAVSAAQLQLEQTQIQAQLNMIATAYGIDVTTLQELMNLDLTNAATKYGMSVEQVNQFRQAIYDMALKSYAGNQQITPEQIAAMSKIAQGG